MKPIATIHTDFNTKFGIPRQAGIIRHAEGWITFLDGYRNPQEFIGLEGYSHIWLIWQFSEHLSKGWKPMVRPPRLGGNTKVGVFATRSPFRPNPLGLSCVRLLGIENSAAQGPLLHVQGADMLDGTPIYDIKPYVPLYDSIPDAKGGFVDSVSRTLLTVSIPLEIQERIPEEKKENILSILAQDPRPSYQHDPERIYGFVFSGLEIKFTVTGKQLTVISVEKKS
ncbi:MAG: tRNA (N6-threonylcarbamoyladenosine(37)-N6)-methyltransferase TrmO [Spirochaetia bacterium]|jgi:tRNA-Thr(GGU) m(6)t(6)A37 methyltransferase TsaA|nr:tRNA (N6-threonylcarbamoyladenosine(37)-N6)-methyltransferase TrmO [Spirochaetia bacterium]